MLSPGRPNSRTSYQRPSGPSAGTSTPASSSRSSTALTPAFAESESRSNAQARPSRAASWVFPLPETPASNTSGLVHSAVRRWRMTTRCSRCVAADCPTTTSSTRSTCVTSARRTETNRFSACCKNGRRERMESGSKSSASVDALPSRVANVRVSACGGGFSGLALFLVRRGGRMKRCGAVDHSVQRAANPGNVDTTPVSLRTTGRTITSRKTSVASCTQTPCGYHHSEAPKRTRTSIPPP